MLCVIYPGYLLVYSPWRNDLIINLKSTGTPVGSRSNELIKTISIESPQVFGKKTIKVKHLTNKERSSGR